MDKNKYSDKFRKEVEIPDYLEWDVMKDGIYEIMDENPEGKPVRNLLRWSILILLFLLSTCVYVTYENESIPDKTGQDVDYASNYKIEEEPNLSINSEISITVDHGEHIETSGLKIKSAIETVNEDSITSYQGTIYQSKSSKDVDNSLFSLLSNDSLSSQANSEASKLSDQNQNLNKEHVAHHLKTLIPNITTDIANDVSEDKRLEALDQTTGDINLFTESTHREQSKPLPTLNGRQKDYSPIRLLPALSKLLPGSIPITSSRLQAAVPIIAAHEEDQGRTSLFSPLKLEVKQGFGLWNNSVSISNIDNTNLNYTDNFALNTYAGLSSSINDKWSIQAGLKYTMLHSRTNYYEEKDTIVQTEYVSKQIINKLNGKVIEERSSTVNNRVTKWSKIDYTNQLQYIGMPVTVSRNISVSRRWDVLLRLGVEYGYVFSTKGRFISNQSSTDFNDQNQVIKMDNTHTNKHFLSSTTAAGIRFSLNQKTSLLLDINHIRSLTDVSSHSRLRLMPNVFSSSFGLQYTL